MKKRILVTGGAGFIGSHLCTRLVNEGHEVICLDNFYTGSKANITHLLSSNHFELVRHDIVLPYQAEVDEIYNLACPASPVHYQHNPVKTIKCSTVGTVNMLGLAKRCRARILQASTSEVYGDPACHPQTEDYWGNVNPIGVRSCYDEGKRVAETLCMDYKRQCGVDIRIVRIFNTYSPAMQINDGRVVSNFIVQALQNKNITIYGDGSHTRSFQYVSDLIEGMVRMMACTDAAACGPINIGNPVEFTIQELALKVIELTNSKSQITYHPLPADDPSKRCPDITLARKLLAWEPKLPLEEGLVPTIAYFEKILKEQKA